MKTSISARACLYVRLSKEDRKGKAEGIESTAVQTADGAKAIQAEGWKLLRTHKDDGITGTTLDRPGLAAIREAARHREIDVVVVRDLDRLGRLEPVEMLTLLRELASHGVKVWSYRNRSYETLSGMESIVTYVRAISNEQYVQAIRKNTTEALRARVREGRAVNSASYGYRIETSKNGKRWVIDPAERDTVLKIARLFVETGSMNATTIALNKAGIRSPKGKPWRVSMVRTLLRRPIYRGFYRFAGDIEVEHPELRIWPAELQAKVDALLARPCKPWGRTAAHLSTPFVRCGICGGNMVATRSTRSSTYSLVCEKSRGRACEGVGYRSEPHVDRALIEAVRSVVSDKVWSKVRKVLSEALDAQRQADDREHQINLLQRDILATERRIRNVQEMLLDAEGSERDLHRASLREHLAKLDGLKASLAQAKDNPPVPAQAILLEAERRLLQLRATLDKGGVEAIPAVRAILGEEKFTATRIEGGWKLKARISSAKLFAVSDKTPPTAARPGSRRLRRCRPRPRSRASRRAPRCSSGTAR